MIPKGDKIILSNLSFYGYHGLLEEETVLGQRFIVDLELYVDISQPGKTDKMEDSVHYGEVYKKVEEIVKGDPFYLIEALTENIAQQLLKNFDMIEALTVRVKKPQAPIVGEFDYVATEIYRERD